MHCCQMYHQMSLQLQSDSHVTQCKKKKKKQQRWLCYTSLYIKSNPFPQKCSSSRLKFSTFKFIGITFPSSEKLKSIEAG
jgi:hypothetical protein